jgi:hypothetical protein
MNIKKTFYLVTLAVLVAVAVAGYLLVPTFSGASTVSAQESASKADGGEVATPEMLRYALDFKADDMAKSFSALNQLPCTEVSDTDLSGKSFKAGVYCLSSAQLAGQMVLDGDNDPSSIFIFKIAGSLNTKNGSSVELTNNAQAANIFFVANDVANVRQGTNFRGMILAKNAVKVDEGATIEGRLLSLNNKVSAPQSAMSPQQFGTLQICKTLRAGDTTAASLLGRFFTFTVTGIATPITLGPFTSIGQMICTGALNVPAGPATITELNQTNTNATGGGMLTGGFQLFGVNVLSPAVPAGTTGSTIGTVNLSARTVGVNIVSGGANGNIPTQLTIELVNRAAITGFIEICKRAAATAAGGTSSVTGTFSFVVEGVFNANGVGLQVFTVPVGQCTNAIAVNIGDPAFGGTVFISELGRQGFFLTNVTNGTTGAQLGVDLNLSLNQTTGFGPPTAPLVNSTGGGTVLVAINPTTTTNAAGEVVVNFVNQAVALAKVCKIAGPGVAIGTQFVFQVEGTSGATATSTTAAGGFTFGNVVRAVVVPAGDPASGGNCVFVPGIGGAGVAGTTAAGLQTFLSGTPIRVFELGAVAGTGGTGTGAAGTTGGTVLNVGTAAGNGAGAQVGVNVVTTLIGGEAIRVARIRTSSTFTSTTLAGFSPNPTLTPGTRTAITTGTDPVVTVFPATTFLGAGSVFAQAGVTEIEFVDVGFSPATLKVCKIAGTGFPLNTAVTFDVAVVSPNTTGGVPGGTTPIFSTFTVPVTVNAGPAAQGGNCTFVDPTLGTGTLMGGFFDIGSTVTITERASGTTQVTGITSSTATTSTATGGLTVNTAGRVATLSGTGGLVAGVNIVTFTNGTVAGGDVKFDFDGDGRSDFSVYRPSNGTWYINNSGATGSKMASTQFGEATDKTVPADYDNDGKADVAVFRPSNGSWYIMGSKNGLTSVQYGAAGDIPVPADFDGDKKADVAVFRPSTGTWYLNRSTDGSTGVQFGQAGDQPVAADFDGDGKADLAVFRPSNGIWYINQSSGGVKAIQFGIATDTAVAADYDGDGKADVAVFRNNGNWYVMGSTDGFKGVQYGQAGDIPVAADYDGDGKADMSVYRNGTWYALQSRDGHTGVQFGMSTDTPIPASFLRP